MPDDYYDDSPAPAAGGASPAQPEGDEKDGDSKTSILPKDFFHGKDVKPGDTCHLTVTAVHENDVEVTCDHEDDEQPPDDDEGAEPEPAPAPQEGSMASMMQ